MFRVGITTASLIVLKTCRVLWITLKQEVFTEFSEDAWQQIAIRFEARANFPYCIGAIDGKHIRVIKPEHSASLYYNYKNYFSVVLMAIADSDYKFIYILMLVHMGKMQTQQSLTGLLLDTLWNLGRCISHHQQKLIKIRRMCLTFLLQTKLLE